jgi:hypothetical protein
MISKKIFFITALFLGSSACAVVDGNDILWGSATGLLARGTSYALKQQGQTTNKQAMLGAAFATALATVAVQSNKQGGGMRGGVAQLATAFATFVVTMYIWPTLGDEDYGNAYASKGHTDHAECAGNCKH